METKTDEIIINNQQETNSSIRQTSNEELNLRKKAKKRDRSPISNDITSKQIVTNTNSAQPSSPSSHGTTQIASINKKEKQRPETWNKIEQQIFFNALRQNGKNFESITQHFNARQKKYKVEDGGGVNVQRSKEQIRHFYYRTWHKVIKYVSLPMLKDCDGTTDPINNKNNSSCLRDIQVKCLIAYNCLMNKSQSKIFFNLYT
jgi:hypothetical protein